MLSTTVNTLLTTMLMGLWFGIRLNYLVWGIYFAGFILLENVFDEVPSEDTTDL